MSKTSRKYRALLDNKFELKLLEISDNFKRNLVRHDISYRDLPDLEDQGLKERTSRFRCFFIRDAYDKHYEFIDHISKKRTEFVLTHPVYGQLKGGIESVDIRHDKRQRTAEVDFTFVQSGEKVNSKRPGEIKGDAEDSVKNGVKDQEKAVSQETRNIPGADADPVLDAWLAQDTPLDPDKGILEQFSDVTGSARDFVRQVDSAVSTLEGTLSEIANPANSLIGTIEFATNLPGRVIGSIARTAERYAILYETAKSAPSRFVQNFRSAMDNLENVLGLNSPDSGTAAGKARTAARKLIKDNLMVMGAQMAALQLGYMFSADEVLRDKARKLEDVRAFDTQGNRIATGSLPDVLDIREIERALAAVREYIQDAVDRSRGTGNLKAMAHNLLRHVNEIKLEREKIARIWLDNPMHILALCHSQGLPYSFAPRVMSLNPGLDANFARGEVFVYVR